MLHSLQPGAPLPSWFALRVLHQHEKTVAFNLHNLGFESFLPLYRSRRFWSDRLKDLDLPLFPGYVFSRFSLPSPLPLLNTPGVRSLVSFAGAPAPIPDLEIASLKLMVASGLPIHPWPFLKAGQRILITRGPLCGLEGVLVDFKGQWRVVVSVNLLQRSVAAEVDRLCVSPINPRI